MVSSNCRNGNCITEHGNVSATVNPQCSTRVDCEQHQQPTPLNETLLGKVDRLSGQSK